MNELDSIETALESIAYQLKWLGNADACTNFGAIEAHGIQIGKIADEIGDLSTAVGQLDGISGSIEYAGEHIKEGLADLANAIRSTNTKTE